MNTRIAIVLVIWSALIAGVGIWVTDLVMQSLPMPLGGAVLIGVLGWWVLRRRILPTIAAALIGHVTLDAALSALIAAVIIVVAVAPVVAIQCRARRHVVA